MDWYKMSQTDLSRKVMSLRSLLAAAAQKVYDGWKQDESGQDEILGPGGICQDVADSMADVLIENGINAYIMESQVGEQHVWVIAYDDYDAYHVDIPPETYEAGGGYSWTKLPDVQFEETDVSVSRADRETVNFIRNEL